MVNSAKWHNWYNTSLFLYRRGWPKSLRRQGGGAKVCGGGNMVDGFGACITTTEKIGRRVLYKSKRVKAEEESERATGGKIDVYAGAARKRNRNGVDLYC